MTGQKTRTFKIHKGRNFTGFVHPDTNRLVTATKPEEFIVDEKDIKAIEILESAKDLYEID